MTTTNTQHLNPVEHLSALKKQHVRDPGLLASVARKALKYSSGTDDEWTAKEALLLGLLDCHEVGEAQALLKELDTQFPESQRVDRLRGLLLETNGKLAEANELYKDMVKKNPGNTIALKRQIAVLRASGKLKEAEKKLNEFLTIYQCDAEAWQELGSVYMALGSFKSAAFCYEEMMLLDNQSYLCPLVYAELLHTVGDGESLVMARKYFSHSLVLNPSRNVRALWGLSTATHAVAESKSKAISEEDRKVNVQLSKFAEDGLLKEYEKNAPSDLAELTRRVLNKRSLE